MPGRPRTVSDDDILAAARRVLHRVGPARLTLALVAREVGLVPATILQRFGSRRGLLLAYAAHAVTLVEPRFEAARAAARSPLVALRRAFDNMSAGVATPEALAHSLAILQLDLTDPDFNRHARDFQDRARAEVRALLDAAVAAGELCACDTARLARAVYTAYNGALVIWAIDQDGPLADWLRTDIDQVLAPFVAAT